MKLLLGAEVLLCPRIENMEGLDRLCLEGTNTLLLELPLDEHIMTEDHFSTIEVLAKRYDLVIAHANRYSDESIQRAVNAGAKIQLNAEDICRRSERKRTERWLMNGLVVAIGSDAHRKVSVYRKFKKAVDILSKYS